MLELDLPLRIALASRKMNWFSLNLNQYRNMHHYQNNELKTAFKDIVQAKLKTLPNGVPKFDKVHIHYVLYRKTNRRADLMNVIAVVDKFFSDALVEAGVISDDHDGVVVSVSASTGGTDKDNPRVSVQVIPTGAPLALT